MTRHATPLVILLVVAFALAGCDTARPTTRPSEGEPTAVSTPASVAPATPTADEPGQTDTEWEWGRIWDDIPASFPRYPGSIPTETGDGPLSASLAVPTDAGTAAEFMQAALERATYSTEAKSGPFEDGSFVIDSVGVDPACRIETRLAPASGTTIMTVLFGAACPFE